MESYVREKCVCEGKEWYKKQYYPLDPDTQRPGDSSGMATPWGKFL